MEIPILVGAGQFTEQDPVPQRLSSALDLAVRAAEEAIKDTQASGSVVDAIDTLAWVRTFSDSAPQFKSQFGFSNNPPRSLANRLSLNAKTVIHTPAGGNVPQELVNEMAGKIMAGDLEMAMLAGGEAIANEVFAMKNNLKPDWSETTDDECEDRGLGITGLATEQEVSHGALNFAPVTYTLFENVARHQLGHSLAEHRAYMAELMYPFTETARANPFTMFPELPGMDDLLSTENPVTSSYNKNFCAREKVNQSAVLIVTSVKKARELGIPESRWIYFLGGAEASEKTLLRRKNLASSEALSSVCEHLFSRLGVSSKDFRYLDLYSCFPVAVEAALTALGIAPDDPRKLTLTGGLPYFGGPGNNYSMHAIAEMVNRLREDRKSLGLVTANGGILSKQAVGVYSGKPREQVCQLPDKHAVQSHVDATAGEDVSEKPTGAAEIETYAVRYSRGKAAGAIVIARLSEGGGRCIANVDEEDTETLASLEGESPIGMAGVIEGSSHGNLFRKVNQKQ